MSSTRPPADGLEAITLDFGNTLVPFSAAGMARTVELAARRSREIDERFGHEEFIRLWHEERDRQLRENVPEGREMDMPERAVRVLARLRGCDAPPPDVRWDDVAAARWSTEAEVQRVLNGYADAFLETTPVPPEVGPFLARLARRYRLAVLSNWPLAAAIERYLDAAGWRPSLLAVVVSQSAGCIKPAPAIFLAAAEALGVRSGPALLHAGDDLGADVGGAQALGWRTAWIRARPDDSPLPVAPPALVGVAPDIVVDRVTDLEAALEGAGGRETGVVIP